MHCEVSIISRNIHTIDLKNVQLVNLEGEIMYVTGAALLDQRPALASAPKTKFVFRDLLYKCEQISSFSRDNLKKFFVQLYSRSK